MIGYEFLVDQVEQHLGLRLPPVVQPAQIKPVTRVERVQDVLAIPRHVAPSTNGGVLDHVLFALKYEALQLAILHEAMRLVSAPELLAAFQHQPKGKYLRKAAFVWEKANHQELPLPLSSTGGNYLDFFDRETYYTGQNWERSPKYRINFNGIGPYEYCPVIQRNMALEAAGTTTLNALHEWANDPHNAEIADRVMGWAYLSETRDSFAIENEIPSPDKEKAFLQAMAHLSSKTPLSSDYLVQLQNTVITTPYKIETQFRIHQNWLQRGGHGVLAVRYVPPPPEVLPELMNGFIRMANAKDGVPPLIKAALVSFGFVFLHPFMDGNGRISRLLAHHSLSYNNALPQVNGNPAILPLSVAMKKLERQYLAALESFSKPACKLWDIGYLGDSHFVFDFQSTPHIYAHWMGQRVAEFVTECAQSALQQSLIEEAWFIQAYDQAFDQIDRAFDLSNRTINLLIQWIRQNNCRMPERRKNAEELLLLQPEQVQMIEDIVAKCFQPKSPTP